MNTMMQEHVPCVPCLGALEVHILDGTQGGLNGIQKVLCGI